MASKCFKNSSYKPQSQGTQAKDSIITFKPTSDNVCCICDELCSVYTFLKRFWCKK